MVSERWSIPVTFVIPVACCVHHWSSGELHPLPYEPANPHNTGDTRPVTNNSTICRLNFIPLANSFPQPCTPEYHQICSRHTQLPDISADNVFPAGKYNRHGENTDLQHILPYIVAGRLGQSMTSTQSLRMAGKSGLLQHATICSRPCLTSGSYTQVHSFVSRTKTVAGHNLEPTPWHIFPGKTNLETGYTKASKVIQCSYFKCGTTTNLPIPTTYSYSQAEKCPDFYRWIHHDLEPWHKSRISMAHLMETKRGAAFRVTIIDGRLFVDSYYGCVQSRSLFTVWGLVQLLRRYPGRIPDVDFMFDCMDKPIINRTEHASWPLPLFRYCTTAEHFDIPFPDWSFWGWSEINISPWDEEFKSIKRGAQSKSWKKKIPFAYWKGNPDVVSPIRLALLECNDTQQWGAKIMRQDWAEEVKSGFSKSKLSSQCKHRYKIYAEGYAWSVSLKYILSCGSLPLIIHPEYEDFFSRGLIPKKNYWPISPNNLCPAIKFAVEWGNQHNSEAEGIGKAAQDFMESLSMDRIYDYMYHLINEYSKLLDFKPVRPPTALEICYDSLLCYADEKQRSFLERSTVYPSPNPPCKLPPADSNVINSWMEYKKKVIQEAEVPQ